MRLRVMAFAPRLECQNALAKVCAGASGTSVRYSLTLQCTELLYLLRILYSLIIFYPQFLFPPEPSSTPPLTMLSSKKKNIQVSEAPRNIECSAALDFSTVPIAPKSPYACDTHAVENDNVPWTVHETEESEEGSTLPKGDRSKLQTLCPESRPEYWTGQRYNLIDISVRNEARDTHCSQIPPARLDSSRNPMPVPNSTYACDTELVQLDTVPWAAVEAHTNKDDSGLLESPVQNPKSGTSASCRQYATEADISPKSWSKICTAEHQTH